MLVNDSSSMTYLLQDESGKYERRARYGNGRTWNGNGRTGHGNGRSGHGNGRIRDEYGMGTLWIWKGYEGSWNGHGRTPNGHGRP